MSKTTIQLVATYKGDAPEQLNVLLDHDHLQIMGVNYRLDKTDATRLLIFVEDLIRRQEQFKQPKR